MNNKTNKETIYLDQQGYNEFLKSIERIENALKKNNMGRKEAFDSGAGDGWDSPEFEEIERNNTRLTGELLRKKDELSRIVIIEKHNNQETVDVGDVILVDMIYAVDDTEEMTLKIVGGDVNIDADIQEVSINSPLGSSVYKKQIGDTCYYSVNDRNFSVMIKEKVNLTKQTDPSKRKLTK